VGGWAESEVWVGGGMGGGMGGGRGQGWNIGFEFVRVGDKESNQRFYKDEVFKWGSIAL